LSTWAPILSPESKTYARAWDSINAITDAIFAQDYKPTRQETFPGRGYEEALLYGYMAVAHNDLKWANEATQCLNLAIENASGRSSYLGLYGGIAGLGWTVEHISQLFQQATFAGGLNAEDADDTESASEETPEEDLNADVDALLLRNLPRMTASNPYDLISGLVGFGVYFLERLPKESARQGISAVFDQLERLAQHSDGGIAWYSGPELLPEWQREKCPNGYYNLGVAHGIPGIIHFLSEVSATDIVPPDRVGKLLQGSVEWLIAHARPTGSLSRFSSWFIPDQESADGRMAWCYGDIGILAVLRQVARRSDRSDWLQFTDDLLDHCLALPLDKTGVADAPLCHGAAGVAHIFNRIYQAEGDRRCRDYAILWFERTMEMRQPGSGVGGFSSLTRPDPDRSVVWEANPAFLDGASGIALALLSAVTSAEPGWDRMLLLSGKDHAALPQAA